MFFISSGALSVNLKDGAVTLGSGEFFGEIALLKGDAACSHSRC